MFWRVPVAPSLALRLVVATLLVSKPLDTFPSPRASRYKQANHESPFAPSDFHPALLAGRSGRCPVVDVRPAHPLPQRHRVDPETVATCSTVTPGSRFLATRTTSGRNSSDKAWTQQHPSHPPYRASQFRCHPIAHQTRPFCSAVAGRQVAIRHMLG